MSIFCVRIILREATRSGPKSPKAGQNSIFEVYRVSHLRLDSRFSPKLLEIKI